MIKQLIGLWWAGLIILLQLFNLGGTPDSLERAAASAIKQIVESNHGR